MNMKNYLIPLFVFTLLMHSSIYAQSDYMHNANNKSRIEISVIKNSEASMTSVEHVYVLKAVNKIGKAVVIKIAAANIICTEKENVQFNQKVYWNESCENVSVSNISSNVIIPENGIIEFYVKLIRPFNTKLNSWNCTEIKAIGADDKILSNCILLESFNPDPKNFR